MKNTDDLLQLASTYENECQQSLTKFARIRKLPGGKYRVLSEKGKNLGTSETKGEAVKRLRQVEYFKHHDKSKANDSPVIDLTGIDEFAYSAIMRKLRQKGTPKQVKDFLKLFKLYFDKAVKNDKHDPDRIALQNAMVRFSKMHKVKLDKDMVKSAAVAELGNAEAVGRYLSDIVKFILNRIPTEKRQHATEVLKQKFSMLNESEISSKNLPQAAAYGQAITFVKHVLFNQDARYVREVLNSLVRSL
jgi:hypothetical protein